MKRNVTMQDIADHYGVSKVTVSKALNDKDGVSDDLKKKIQDTAREMGYRFNSIARSLKDSATYNIGVIIPERFIEDNANAFYMTFYQQIARQLDEKGYSAILHMLKDEDEEETILPRIYYDNKVDGMIILGQISAGYIEVLENVDVPVIFLDFYDEHASIDSVISDSFFGTYEITNFLFKKGHDRLAFVGNIYATSSIQDRFLGFYKSLLEHKVALDPAYVLSDRNDQGKLIPVVLPQVMPSAFVCNCDQVAHRLIGQLQAEGYKVPGDVSVVGFDNDIYATITKPGITTVAVNTSEMCERVIQRILAKIQDGDLHFGRLSIKGTIVIRESVKDLTI